MGGLGSGNREYRRNVKPLVENCYRLDVNALSKKGLFDGSKEGVSFQWKHFMGAIVVTPDFLPIVVCDARSVDKSKMDSLPAQDVYYLKEPCRFGGFRFFLFCPGCKRRCTCLYLRGDETDPRFLCRACHGLAYAVQTEPEADSLLRAAKRIRRRLPGSSPAPYEEPVRPRGMHERTFRQLVMRENELIQKREEVMWQRMEKIMDWAMAQKEKQERKNASLT